MSAPRLAILADFPEERWPSMDLFAEMLERELAAEPALHAERVCPPFRRRVTRLPFLGRWAVARNADRLLNRMWDYPRAARPQRDEFDLFHICDHSYSQLVHELPPERTGVFCHDLDTFRCLFEPRAEPRPRWFRATARRILAGLEKAALVFHTTRAVRDEILAHGIVDPERLVAAPPGVAPEFHPEADGPDPTAALLAPLGGVRFLLHVGSTIPRKRIDVLLEAFAALRRREPDLRLVKVGGSFSEEQRRAIARLGIEGALLHLPHLRRSELAALYRRAAAVLVPSEKEGFGIPVVEALACGSAVVASDIPTLREAGGAAAVYVPVGDAQAFAEAARGVIERRAGTPGGAERLAQAARFSWRAHAGTIAEAYLRLIRGGAATPVATVEVQLCGSSI